MTASDTDTSAVYGQHFRGIQHLHDVSDVDTPTFTAVRLRMMETIEIGGMMRVSGPVGHGKTFATARAVQYCAKRHPDMTVTWVELAGAVRGRGLAVALYEQIIGPRRGARPSLAELRVELAEHLTTRLHLIVCDEAQHVSNEAMHLLRWLYDANGSQLVVVFCGVDELRRPMPPEINSRIVTSVRFEPIPDDEAPTLLRQFHPMFQRVDAKLLKSVNRREARGEWRWWCKFLSRATIYAANDEQITQTMFAALIKDMNRT